MRNPHPRPRLVLRRSIAAVVFGVLAAVASQLAARALVTEFGADPVWLLPTVTIGFIAVAVLGVLLLRLFTRRR